MKKILLFSPILLLIGFAYAFAPKATSGPTVNATESGVKWYTWEEASKANKNEKKKFFVDIYTDWCGWCKRMDRTTYKNPEVVKYLNTYFYPVKLNAEQKEDIKFNGQTFKWKAGGKNGIHSLAYSLVDGHLSYPTVVYLTENYERIMISPGYKQPKGVLKELKFAAEERYATTSWNDYQREN